MVEKMPARLKREPLIEAVWEIRFSGADLSIADLLPGMIFRAFPGRFSAVRLPLADVPAPVVEHEPSLRYGTKLRLEKDNQTILIGGRVVSLSYRRPYPGWKCFSDEIRKLADVVKETGLVRKLERLSLKYIDLIQPEQSDGIDCLSVSLRIAGQDIVSSPVQLRTEIAEGDLVHAVHVASPAVVALPGSDDQLRGVLLDIDTMRRLDESESWDTVHEQLDIMHLACKTMFFGLLTSKTLDELGPEYEE